MLFSTHVKQFPGYLSGFKKHGETLVGGLVGFDTRCCHVFVATSHIATGTKRGEQRYQSNQLINQL